ncbi:MAG TPA: hypothetical protein VH589_04450 [Trebonia sp.]
MRPAVLFGEQRHAEGERVHAGQHLPAGAQHARDLGNERLGGQVPRQRAVLGDHAVRAAVGEEVKPAAVGGHGAQPAARCPAVCRCGRRCPHLWLCWLCDAQHVVAGAGRHLGSRRCRAGT